MSGFDVFLILILVVSVIAGAIRGFSIAVLDLIAVYSAFLASLAATPYLEAHLPGLQAVSDSQLHVVVFVLFAFLLVFLSHLNRNVLNWDLGMCNGFFGACAGFAFGVVFCHAIVSGLALGNERQEALISGSFSQQVLTFSGFHETMDEIAGLTGPRADKL